MATQASHRKSIVVARAPGAADDTGSPHTASPRLGTPRAAAAGREFHVCGFTLSLQDVLLVSAVLVLHTGVTSARTRCDARAHGAARRMLRAQTVPPALSASEC
jgi:hypothetical protein